MELENDIFQNTTLSLLLTEGYLHMAYAHRNELPDNYG